MQLQRLLSLGKSSSVLLVCVFSTSGWAQVLPSKEVKSSEITKESAVSIAVKLVPGVVKEVEHEKHSGQMVYAIEILSKGKLHEVVVEAKNGKVLSDKIKEHDKSEEAGEKEKQD